MVTLRPVTEMKDSGYPFIGTIPRTWKVVSINNIKDYNHPYPIGDGDHGQISPNDYLSEGIPYIRVQNLTWEGQLNLDNVVYISEEVNAVNSKSVLRPNDILVAKTGATIGKTAIIPETVPIANTTSSVGKLTVNPKYSSKYFYYVLSSSVCLTQMWIKAGQKTAQPGFNIVDMAAFRIPFPTILEQQAIADYLDDRCSKLDEIIAEAEKSIEEYKELKQAVIFEAVTKGLDKNVPMKDSGIEWVGAIPSHWLVKKFKYVASVNANLVSPDDYMDYQQIAPDCIEKDSGRLIKDRTVSEAGVESWNQLFRKGQLIYSKIRPILNKVIIAPYDGLCSADMYPLDVIEDIEFVQKAMLSKYFVEQVGLITQDRVKMPKINKEELSNILMVIPPRDEQVEIVKYLKTRLEGFDELIDEKQSLIEDLKAYKKSLIYEVVTGKRRIS